MRFTLLLVLLGSTLAACAQNTAPQGGSAPVGMAANNTVNLTSADGQMFLQSAHTGFLEAPPRRRPARRRTAMRKPSDPPDEATVSSAGVPARAEARQRRSSPEMTERGPVSPVSAPSPGQSRKSRQDRLQLRDPERGSVPEVTVRPRPQRSDARAKARSLRDALASAYDNNPSINRARADLRAADEDVAVARSGNRPTVTARVSAGVRRERDVNTPFGSDSSGNATDATTPASLQLDVTQPLFRGFRTRNETRQAEAGVRAERERLRATRQDILLQTALAFLDVRRFREQVRLRKTEARFLREQVAAARSRLEFGEATSTDVDQALTRQEDTRAALLDAQSSLASAEARFRELTGRDASNLETDIAPVSLLPDNLGRALRTAFQNAPDIARAVHEADRAQFRVKVREGETLPTVNLTGQVRSDIDPGAPDRTDSAEVRLNVDVPLYQGGRVSAQVRQAKEQLGSARITVDLARDTIRSQVTSAWSTLQATTEAIRAATRSIAAARRALDGIVQELRVGQRTTVDVLDAQQDLIRAQITRINARRERDAAAFRLLRSMGALEIDTLGLPADAYNPSEHYSAVKDRWSGLRTPDGR